MNNKKVLTGVILCATLMLSAVAIAADAKPKTDPGAALAEKWTAAWNSHDADRFLPLFTDDALYEDVAFGEKAQGSAGLRKFFLDEVEGIPDLQLKLERANIHGSHGTIEWTFSGTDKGVYKTGKKFSVRGVSVIDLRGGKISRNVDFYDLSTVMRQVGTLPADSK